MRNRHLSHGPAAERRRPVADRLRGVLALAVVLILLVGIPLALYVLRGNPLPDAGTDLPGLLNRLTATDTDGSLFLGALTWIGWLAWASFAVTVGVEATAAVRGLPTPRLPALGPQQRLAGLLGATSVLLFAAPLTSAAPALGATTPASSAASTSASTSAPSASPAVPVVQEESVQEQARTAAAPVGSRTHVVQPGDTLWQIAADHLGDGARYTEIAQLNYGAAQPGGGSLTAAHWLTPGWHLTLPASPTVPGGGAERTVVVEPGDTLWQIAADHLGDGARYPDIAEASTSRQDDGARLVDPDLIRPGWTLRLPGANAPGATDAAAEPPVPTVPGAAPAEPVPPSSAGPDTPPTPLAPAPPVPDCAAPPSAVAAPQISPVVPAQAPAPEQESAPEPDDDVTVRTAGGVGALLAASMLALLGLKRARQHRRRLPGQRIAMPPPQLQPAELELRLVEDPTGLARVDQALRSLSVLLAEQGQPLPVLRLARLLDEDLELYLGGTAALPAPFTATGDPSVWTLSADIPLLPMAELEQVPAPFPSLVTIGHDLDDAHVLLDLEHAATLAIDGDPEVSVAVLAAIAAELATSRWADDLQVTVVGCLPGLPEALGTGRLRHAATLAELLPTLERRATSVRELMADSSIPDLQHARSAANQHLHSGAWCPQILLLGGPVELADRDRLEDLLHGLPRVSLATVSAAASAPTEWTLSLDPTDSGPDATAVLRPVNLALRPQRLTASDLDQLLALLAVADLPSEDLPGDPNRPPLIQTELTLADFGSQISSTTETALQYESPPGMADPTTETLTDTASPDEGETGTDAEGTGGGVRAATEWHEDTRPPLVQVLGPVTVLRARGVLEAGRRGQLTEIAAFLAMHPGLDHTHLDAAKWPGSRTLEKTRNTALNKLRSWLGSDDAGDAYVPYVLKDGYRLHPAVRSDWDLWLELLPDGPASASTKDLAAALELVKGQPFAGAKKKTYAWADRDKQDMISAVGDAAHELARRALLAGNATLARQAAAAGLQADPGAERLWRDALRAEWHAGDLEGLKSTADRLIDLASRLGDDLEPETDELLGDLLSRVGAR